MDYITQWNEKGGNFRILMVGKPEDLDFFVDSFIQRGLERNQEKPNFLEGRVVLHYRDEYAYQTELTIENEEEFKAMDKSQLPFDGLMIYYEDAHLIKPSIAEPYLDWHKWGEIK